MNKYKKITIGFRPLIIAFLVLALGLAGCKKDDGDDTTAGSNDIILQAKIAQTDTTSSEIDTLLGTQSVQSSIKSSVKTRATANISLKLYCVTFTSPPIPGEGDSDAEGNISLTLLGAKDKPFGCFILNKDTGDVLATLVIADPDEKSLDGTSSKSGSISFSGSVNLGNILLDLERGIAVVDRSKITFLDGTSPPKASDTSGELFDFTGTWTMTNIDNPPNGYVDMCSEAEAEACHGETNTAPADFDCSRCEGPSDGMDIYLKRVKGDKVNADGTPDTTKQVYGIMIWESIEARNNCGKVLGFTETEAKTDIGIDFSSYLTEMELDYGPFDWATTVTLNDNTTATLDEGWKISTATANWEMWDWYFDTTDTTDGPEGTWVTFTPPNGTKIVSQYDYCSAISLSGGSTEESKFREVLQLQCYANYYYENIDRENPNYCIKRIETDWRATDPAKFLKSDNRSESLFVFEKFVYTGPSSGTFTQYEERYGGYRYTDATTAEEKYVDCKVSNKFTMSVTKVSDTEMIGDFQSENKMIDADIKCTDFATLFPDKTGVIEDHDMESSSARFMLKMKKVQ